MLLLLLLVLLLGPGAHAEFEECRDRRNGCANWAEAGECWNEPILYHKICPESCHLCDLMEKTIEFGVKQHVSGQDSYEVSKTVRESLNYMNSDAVLELEAEVFLKCVNQESSCSQWAYLGGENERSVLCVCVCS
jgi:hypothetical protein